MCVLPAWERGGENCVNPLGQQPRVPRPIQPTCSRARGREGLQEQGRWEAGAGALSLFRLRSPPPRLPFDEHLLPAPRCAPDIHTVPESSRPRPAPRRSHTDRDTTSRES